MVNGLLQLATTGKRAAEQPRADSPRPKKTALALGDGAAMEVGGEEEAGPARAAGEAAAGAGGKGRAGKGRGRKDAVNSSLITSLAKLVLSHDDSIRALESVVFYTYLLPKESLVGEAAKAAGQNYAQQARDSTAEEWKQKDMAPPHVYVYLAVAENLLATAKPDLSEPSLMEKEQIENLMEMVEAVKSGNNSQAVNIIPFFRTKTAYDGQWKVQFRSQTERYSRSIAWFLEKKNGVQKLGQAPRGAQQRVIQKELDKGK